MNNRAFTLMESLMALVVLSVVIFLLFNFLALLSDNRHLNYKQKEMILLTSQIQEDLLEAKDCTLKENSLILKTYLNDKISYEMDDDRLVRKVNSKGYEIILNQLESVEFKNNKGTIYIMVKFKGDSKEYKEALGSVK